MKKVLLIIQSLVFTYYLAAQNGKDVLQIEQYQLKNGLTVYLNEDHPLPIVFGGVVVKGGAKRDPKDATGIAHYFEHIMFKGTDSIGTINYEEEKKYLDSITSLYEILRDTKDPKEKEKINIHINNLSLKAAEYAIPNEFFKIMDILGATGVNAFTSYEQIVYHNSFPPHQIEKWLEIYSHRFKNPVFRLFQSELEVVYEEKNMSIDNHFNNLFEKYIAGFYKNFPYGTQTVLGSVEHLKNPSIKKMMDYFNTYYVANNMALILVGDFKKEEVKPLIEKKFGVWKSGDIPAFPDYKENDFNGREKIVKRLTPIKVGIIGFRTVPKNHPDEIALNICNSLLFNNNKTGLFNQLMLNNEILAAMGMPLQFAETGSSMFIFIPKIIGQSLPKAEKKVLAQFEKLRKGNFDEQLLEGVKLQLIKEHEQKFENVKYRGYLVLDAFLYNQPWQEILNESEQIKKITKQDIIDVANKYYNKNYLVMYSKMGFPKKEKLKKPTFKPVTPHNSETKSAYYQKIEQMPEKNTENTFIDFNKDVQQLSLAQQRKLFCVGNPVNKIFNLTLSFGVGRNQYPILDYVAQYMNLVGSKTLPAKMFNSEMQKHGAELNFYVDEDKFEIEINSFDEHFAPTLDLVNLILNKPEINEKKLSKLLDEAKAIRKLEKKSIDSKIEALNEFALYGNNSVFLNRLSVKEVAQLNVDSLINMFRFVLQHESDFHYSGTLKAEEVKENIINKLQLPDVKYKSHYPAIRQRNKLENNIVYFINDPKTVQSHLRIYVDGDNIDAISRSKSKLFTNYFNELTFQNIREFHSFAYHAAGYYNAPSLNNCKGYLNGQLSTQADKTLDALNVFIEMIKAMPEKPERTEYIQKYFINSINSTKPSFRGMSKRMAYWQKQGYTSDPREIDFNAAQQLTFNDILSFYQQHVKGRPYVISIVGDKKRFDVEKLETYGTVKELELKDIYK